VSAELDPVALTPPGTELAGRGFTSFVYRDAKTNHTIRIFRNDSGLRYARRSADVLRSCADLIEIATPWPVEIVEPSESWPYGGSISRWIEGTPLTPATMSSAVVDKVAGALATLHRVDPRTIHGVEALPHANDNGWDGLRATTNACLSQRLSVSQMARLQAWWDAWIALSIEPGLPQAICHGDAWHENILITAEGVVAGMIDWDHMKVDDPAQDIVALESLGSVWLRACVEAWADHMMLTPAERAHAWQRIELGLPARHFGGLNYAIRYHGHEELEDSIAKLAATGVWS